MRIKWDRKERTDGETKMLVSMTVHTFYIVKQKNIALSLGSKPSPYTQFISACGTHKKWGRPGLKYHVRIVGGAIGKALLLFPEACRSPSHLVEELLASRIICTTYGLLSIWLLR